MFAVSSALSSIILALDIGSSSIRCSAYLLSDVEATQTSPIENCRKVRRFQTVDPVTGKINMTLSEESNLLDEIDSLIDECLETLRISMHPFRIVGLGFSSFVMNLVAVDESGKVVGGAATLSYACHSHEVASACRTLKRCVKYIEHFTSRIKGFIFHALILCYLATRQQRTRTGSHP